MEWDATVRSCLPLLLLVGLFSSYIAWGYWLPYWNGGYSPFNLTVFESLLPTATYLTMGAAVLLGVGGLIYWRRWPSMWFQHCAANYYGLVLVWGGYLTGGLSLASGVALIGAPLVGFLLLERRVVVVAFLVSFSTLLYFNFASAFDWMPYAPLMVEPRDRASVLAWINTHLFFAAPHIFFQVAVAALILGQWRLREAEAIRQSLTDALTGIHNRRSLFQILDRQVAHAHKQEEPLAVALLDLDHFKRINDEYGHPTGDAALKAAAAVLEKGLSEGDSVGRFGGEEFMLVMPNCSRSQCQQRCEALRKSLERVECYSENGEAIALRGSFGVVWYSGQSQRPLVSDGVVQVADAALYRAKNAGRNQVVLQDIDDALLAAMPVRQQRPASRSIARRFSDIRLGEFLRISTWRQVIQSILEWSPVSKACFVLLTWIYMAVNAFGWLLYLTQRQDADEIINLSVAEQMLYISAGAVLLSVILLAVGRWLSRVNRYAYWFQSLVLHLYGQGLVGFGYFLGILYIPTGAMLLCSPVIGFLIIERRVLLQVFSGCLLSVVGLAYLSAFEVLPYAPLISVEGTAWQLSSPFWVASSYFFITFLSLLAFVLMGYVVSRWSLREAEVRQLSLVDPLTQIHNRLSIMQVLDQALSQHRREGSPIAVVMLDIDHFKAINDNWGHPVGDRILTSAASVLANNLREFDEIGRYGGEEFLLVLQGTDVDGAVVMAERCRQSLATIQVLSDEGASIGVSASFGVAASQAQQPTDIEALIQRADRALYRAKEKGRNRVEQ
ncbi:signaling protein with membrane-bound sensor domain and ggdef domain [gamma proteobacterium HTCC5015]|nr:signaling protein with membrane-bound sensor domain and ggdef domain [gamma proteobacterium HTCC5015]